MISLQRIQRSLIYLFVFLGPFGNFGAPQAFPAAFRLHYLLFPLFPIFFIRLTTDEWKRILCFFPFFIYCLISAYFTQWLDLPEESFPLMRALLFFSQYLFISGAACHLKKASFTQRLINIYLCGLFFTLIIGYLMYIGFYINKLSIETMGKYCIETQFAYNTLRFSPGSYANEFGVLTSFACFTILLTFHRPRIFKYSLLLLCLIACLLTTTRAAYLAFICSIIYLLCISVNTRKSLFFIVPFTCLAIVILHIYSINIVSIISQGATDIMTLSGSAHIRLADWGEGIHNLNNHKLWGCGFGSHIHTHNIYLELLYELGFIGILILFINIGKYLYLAYYSPNLIPKSHIPHAQLINIGFIHVYTFALTNHNMHHYLTWLTILLFNHLRFSLVDQYDPHHALNTQTLSPQT